ncbi:MAG: hypothetical protein HZB55_00440 [Deltaproteobacteria bacterium]|nr:hypothetical protein [Deltaproteobacteria bacterium]
MAKSGGYTGQILHVDLSAGASRSEPLAPHLRQEFLGGGCINARLAGDLIPPGAAALSPDNALLFGSGPFVGTLIPGSGKSNVTYRSPLTGWLGSSGGGHLGMLKFAGYDHLVVKGRAERPSVLLIRDDRVELRDATHLWGKDTFETAEALWDEEGGDLMVMAIGPAGENLLANAGIVVDQCTAYARGGSGAVMGSKNLKAIAVRGTKGIAVSDPARFASLVDEAFGQFRAQPALDEWRRAGTLISLDVMTKLGVIPARNFRETASAEAKDDFSLDAFLRDFKQGDVACMGCPVGCKHYIRPKTGAHAGEGVTVGCMNSVVQSLGNYCGIRNWDDVVSLARTCNRMGIDWYDFADMYAFVAELQEKGLVGVDRTDGLDFRTGSGDTAARMLEKMIRREGLGEAFAQGLRGVVGRLGFASSAVEVKGMGVMLDPRAVLSCDAFSQIVNPRGGHGSMVSFTMLGGDPEKMRARTRKFAEKNGFPPDATERVTQGPIGYNVARLTKWVEDFSYAMDGLGVCTFAMYQRIDTRVWVDLYRALTGLELTAADLLRAGERGLNAKRAFNLREGATRADDRAPPKFVDEALAVAGGVRPPLGKEAAEFLVDEYYDERGWSPEGPIRSEKRAELAVTF